MRASLVFTVYDERFAKAKNPFKELQKLVKTLVDEGKLTFTYGGRLIDETRRVRIIKKLDKEMMGNIFEDRWEDVEIKCIIPGLKEEDYDGFELHFKQDCYPTHFVATAVSC